MKVFKEEQRFTQPWLLVVVLIALVVPIGIMTQELLKENSTMSLTEVIWASFLILLCLLPVLIFKLQTRIDEKGIHYQFYPLHLKPQFLAWHAINKAYVRNYNPISEYGGWGIKGGLFWNKANGTAINIKGSIGLQLELKSGKRLLIGTQKETEIQQVLAKYKS